MHALYNHVTDKVHIRIVCRISISCTITAITADDSKFAQDNLRMVQICTLLIQWNLSNPDTNGAEESV